MAMFREPALYTKLSKDHLREASQSLARYCHYINSSPFETVLDIGCGPGDVTYSVILPSLHPSFSSLVGIDISRDMIEFAKDRWPEESRLYFRTLDAAERDIMEIRNSLPATKFDKIFSFCALQWVSDRRQLAQNLCSLLAPNGQAFLVLVVNSGVYIVWDTLIKCNKWSKYFEGVKVPLNEYQYMEDPGKELKRTLEEAGLEVAICEVQSHRNAFSSNIGTDIDKIERLKSVDPLVSLVPDEFKDDYLADVLVYTKKLVGPKGAVDYTSLTVICKKPHTIVIPE